MPAYLKLRNGQTLEFEYGHEVSMAAGAPTASYLVKDRGGNLLAVVPVGEVLDCEVRHPKPPQRRKRQR